MDEVPGNGLLAGPVNTDAPPGCYYGTNPALAFDFVGQPFTSQFVCGPAVGPAPALPITITAAKKAALRKAFAEADNQGRAALFTDLSGGNANAAAGIVPGCYDMKASVTDESTGGAVTINSSECGYVAGPTTSSTVDCSAYQSPLCPSGAVSPSTSACDTADQPPYSGSTMEITINPGAPHAYLISYTGYTPLLEDCSGPPGAATVEASGSGVSGDQGLCYQSPPGTAIGTVAPGTAACSPIATTVSAACGPVSPACPVGSTYLSGGFPANPGFALHISIGVPPLSTEIPAPDGVCKFTVTAEKKYIEITGLTQTPTSCGSQTLLFVEGAKSFFGPPCTVSAVASGIVILETGKNCANEQVVGQPAPGFPKGSTFACANGTLSVTIPNVLKTLTPTTNGVVGVAPTGLSFTFTASGPGGLSTTLPGPTIGGLCAGVPGAGPVTVAAPGSVVLCPTGPGTGSVSACAFIANSIDSGPLPCSANVTTFTFVLPPAKRVVPYVRWAGEKQVLTKCFGGAGLMAGVPVEFTLEASSTAGATLLPASVPVGTGAGAGTAGGGTALTGPAINANQSTVWTTTDRNGCATVIVFATNEGTVNVDAAIFATSPAASTGALPIINEHVFEIFYLKFDHLDLENIAMTTYSSTTLSTPVNSLGFLATDADNDKFPSDTLGGAIPASFSLPNAPGTNPQPAGGYPVPLCGTDLVRAMVHGYFELPGDPSGRMVQTVPIPGNPSNAAGSYVLPAGRWILPEDWPVLATFAGFTAGAPNEVGFSAANAPSSVFAWDLNSGWAFNPGAERAVLCTGASSSGVTGVTGSLSGDLANEEGPCFSQDVNGTAYATAPYGDCAAGVTVGIGPFDPTQACTTDEAGTFSAASDGEQLQFSPSGSSVLGPCPSCSVNGEEEFGFFPTGPNSTYLPNGTLNEWDAPMPAAQVSFGITGGPGFLDQVNKSGLYEIPLLGSNGKPNGNSLYPDPFYGEAIPANPLIPPIINDGGYLWDTYGFRGGTVFGTTPAVSTVAGTGTVSFPTGTVSSPTGPAGSCSEQTSPPGATTNSGGGQGFTYVSATDAQTATGTASAPGACYVGVPLSGVPDTDFPSFDCTTLGGTFVPVASSAVPTNGACFVAPAPATAPSGKGLTNFGAACPVSDPEAAEFFNPDPAIIEVADITGFAAGDGVAVHSEATGAVLFTSTITTVAPGPDVVNPDTTAPPAAGGTADNYTGTPGTITLADSFGGCQAIYSYYVTSATLVTTLPPAATIPPVGTEVDITFPSGLIVSSATIACPTTAPVGAICFPASIGPIPAGSVLTGAPNTQAVPLSTAPGTGGGQGPYPFWQWVPNSSDIAPTNTSATVYSDNHGEAVVSLETGISATAVPVAGVCPKGFIGNAAAGSATLCFLDLTTLGTVHNAAGVAFTNVAAAIAAAKAAGGAACVLTTASGGLGPAPTGTPVVGGAGPAAGQICINAAGGIEFGTGATLGTTTVQAIADYPYVRGLHAPIASPAITKVFTSAFAKTLTVTPISPATGCTPGTTGCGIVGPAGTTSFTVTVTGTNICGEPIVGEPVNLFALGNAGAVVLAGTGLAIPNGTNATTVFLGANGTATASLEVLNTALGTTGLVIKAVFPLERVERLVTVVPGTTTTTTTVIYPPGYNQIGGPPGSNFSSAEALFSWDPATNSYTNATALAGNISSAPPACTGYWAYFAAAMSVSLPATSHAGDTATCNLAAGWNLVGNPFASNASLPSELISGGAAAYHWNGTSYDVVSAIPVGGAVWIFSAAPRTVTLTAL